MKLLDKLNHLFFVVRLDDPCRYVSAVDSKGFVGEQGFMIEVDDDRAMVAVRYPVEWCVSVRFNGWVQARGAKDTINP